MLFDLSLIEEAEKKPLEQKEIESIKQAKQERLEQINHYIKALEALKSNAELNALAGSYPAYPKSLETLMESKEANVYSSI